MLVLSLFPGIGLLDHAFELEGFCVVRGPDLLWGGDVRRFHPPAGRFDGVIGGPPCQVHSSMQNIVRARGYRQAEDLVPEWIRVVREASPHWWLMENVPGVPVPPGTEHHAVLRDHDCGGLTSRRRRLCWAGLGPLDLPVETKDQAQYPTVTCNPHEPPESQPDGLRPLPGSGRRLSVAEALRRMGYPPDHLDECPLLAEGAKRAIGNGVPLAMGRAIARAVRRAVQVPRPGPPPPRPAPRRHHGQPPEEE